MGKKLKLNFGTKNGNITLTENKVQGKNGNFAIPAQIISSDATRFTMDVGSGEIESITAKLKYKTGPKEIKIGIRGTEKDKFIYKSFYQKLLQACMWDSTEELGKYLYQKVKKYDNIGKLIDNPPDYRQIATYNIHPSVLMQKILANGIDQKNQKPIDIKTGLRGTHTFMVRVDKAPFIFKLSKQDMNMYNGEDKYIVSISRDGRLIEEKSIADDGFVGTERLKKDPQSVEFNLTDIEPGIYEIYAKNESNGTDSIITQIESNQSKLVIKNQLFAVVNKPITIYTKDSSLTIQTYHKDFFNSIKLNDTIPLELNKVAENFNFNLEKLEKNKKTDFYKIETPKANIIFGSAGYFAFSPEQYFDPEVIRGTDLNTVASLDEIDYILTSVPKATQEGDWFVSEVTFDPKDIKLDENKKLYFSLEMPDLAKYSGELEIDSFTVEVNLKGALSDKFGKKEPTATPAPSSAPTSEPTKPSATPSVKPTVAPKVSPKPVVIKITNGGAPGGTGTRLVNKLKEMGYVNAKAENSSTKFTNANISYPVKYKDDLEAIESIVKTEYKFISRSSNYKADIITINIGATKN